MSRRVRGQNIETPTYVLGPFELLDLLFEPEDFEILVFAVRAFLFQVA